MEPVAIIGIGCRFPGAHNPQAFWELLRAGGDAVRETPPERWAASFYDEDATAAGKMNTRRGGFLDQIDQFDAAFFKIAPVEAVQMDPQQRLLLEVTWESLEDAGIVPSQLAGASVGVFVGIMSNDYGEISRFAPEVVDAYTCPGNGYCIAANRLSYVFDFHGPSVAVDTACSSSLVAVDLACASLARGECRLAIAGGVNALLSPWGSIYFTKASLMSPDGCCKPFDAGANGIVRGEGAGVVVLKRLADAVADGDAIYAIIRGTAVNQDGRSNGLTAPNRWAQEAVLRAAYERAGVSPGAVQYVEAHGTGTPLGDPLEAMALGAVLAVDRSPEQPCLIGSVKSNLGHLESAAGIAGLIKVSLALKHRAIPPTLHFHTPNPNIPFAALPLRVAHTLTPWPETGPALAGVSSFGFGGTNAHVVLAAAPASVAAPSSPAASGEAHYLLPLSARTPTALRDLAHAYRHFLADAGAGLPLAAICETASLRREHHSVHLALVGRDHAGILTALDAFLHDIPSSTYAVSRGRPRRRFKPVFITDDADARPESLARWATWGLMPLATLMAETADLPAQLRALRAGGHNIFVSLSAEESTTAALADAFPEEDAERLILPLLPSSEDAGSSLRILAALYAFGFPVPWERIHLTPGPAVSLPTYPWQRERFWLQPAGVPGTGRWSPPPVSGNPLLGTPTLLAHLPDQIIWELSLDKPELTYLAQHRVRGEGVMPGAGFLEMVAAALVAHFGAGAIRITELVFHEPLYLRDGELPRVQMVWRTPANRRGCAFQIYSRAFHDDSDWVLHVSGQAWVAAEMPAQEPTGNLAAWRDACAQEETGTDFYARQAARGNQWGPHFQAVQRFWLGPGEAVAELRGPDDAAVGYQFPPAMLDACGHVLAALLSADPANPGGAFVLSHVEQVALYGRPGTRAWSRGKVLPPDDADQSLRRGDVEVYDDAGILLATMRGVHFRYLPREQSPQEDVFFQMTWEPAPPPPTPPHGQNWLIFADARQIGVALATALTAGDIGDGQDNRCTLVWPGHGYQVRSGDDYEIDPQNLAHYQAMLTMRQYDGVVYLWGLDAPSPPQTAGDAWRSGQLAVNLSAVNLLRAAAQSLPDLPILFATRGAYPLADAPVAPGQATLWGLGRAALREFDIPRGKLVDLPPQEDQDAVHALLTELGVNDAETQVAWRGTSRYAARFLAFALPSPSREIPVRADGSYLITGGLGGLGLRTAQWLAQQGAGRLILLGRTGLPPRHRWDDATVLDRFGAQIDAVRRMERAGTVVTVVAADVADADGLGAALAPYLRQEAQPLYGVIHAAGVAARLPLTELTAATLWETLRPKAVGAWLLHTLTAAERLDFFVCYSSVAALLSSPLLGAYSGANAFLDALAHYRARAGMPALSINWGPWAETGMAARDETFNATLLPLPPATALEALAQLLRRPHIIQAAVMRPPTQRHPDHRLADRSSPLHTLTRAQIVEAPIGGGYDLLEAFLRQQLADLLGLPAGDIDAQEALINLGVDSLMALSLKKTMETGLAVSVPIAVFYEGITLAQLATDALGQIRPISPSAGSVINQTTRAHSPRGDEAARLLDRLGELSDAEVDAWLDILLAAEEDIE